MSLRCCAELLTSIDSQGDVQDITFATEVTDGEDSLSVTVYYHRQPRRR
jgi:hypothetical protein